MAIQRWDPFRDIYTLQTRLNTLLEDASRGNDELTTTGSFFPPVDIYEDGNRIVLKLEVPGMKQEDLKIQMENQTLTVRGERKFEHETNEKNYHRVERRYGSFARSFTLPNTVDSEKVQAQYDAGVLSIELGKRAEAKPKQIQVQIGGAKPTEPHSRQVEGNSKSTESKSAAA